MKGIKSVLRRLLREDKGSVLVLVAAALVVMLGFAALVVDIGGVALAKGRLQNACDAAALAAAQELPTITAARQRAMEYLGYNNVDPAEAVISFDPDGTKVIVAAAQHVNFTFARLFSLTGSLVEAEAAATYGGVRSMSGVVPFGIPDQTFVYNQEYKLKAASHDEYGPGNFGALALEFRGAANYRNNLKHGYHGMVSVGDWVSTEPGNMSGPTEDGVNYRLNSCPHTPKCTLESYSPDCPRVMIVPVFDPTELAGRDEVQIVGFAAFLLKGVAGSGNQCEVTGYFLEMVPPEDSRFVLAPGEGDYG
ncbi:MAG: hypothetical protein GX062_04775, partial [Firmicutes bacterium]|nr:hypothetical protein [Bacillota bacterium]